MRRSFTTPFNCTSKSYWKLRFNFTQCLFEHGVFLRPLSCFLSSIWICRGAGCIWCSSGISWPKCRCNSVKIEVKMNFVRRVQSRLRCNSYKTAKWKACVSKESTRQHDSGHKETICLGQPNMLSQILSDTDYGIQGSVTVITSSCKSHAMPSKQSLWLCHVPPSLKGSRKYSSIQKNIVVG